MRVFKYIGLSLLAFGLTFVVIGLIWTKGDLGNVKEMFLADENYQKVVKTGSEVIESVDIDIITHHVIFSLSEDETYTVEYYESEDDRFTFSVNEGKLELVNEYKQRFFRWFYISRNIRTVLIRLPKSFTGSIYCETTTGDANIGDFSELEELTIEMTTGSIEVSNVHVLGNIDVEMTTGNFSISNSTALALTATSTTGDITIESLEVEQDITIRVSTGDISVDNSKAKKVEAHSTTGEIDFDKVKSDTIITGASTGEIRLTILGKKDDYKVKVSTSTGSIRFDGMKIDDQTLNPTGSKYLEATTSTGGITIDFVSE